MLAIDALRMRTVPPPAAGGGAGVSISNRTISDSGTGSGTITAGYKLDNDGSAYKVLTGSTTALEQWLDAGAAGDYEVRATRISGSIPSGTLNAWESLSADRTWSLSATAEQSKTCKLNIEIRDVATATVIDSATITLSADNLSPSGGGGGGGGASVQLTDQAVSDAAGGCGTAKATYSVDSNGTIRDHDNTLLETWLLSGASGDYDVRATVEGGSVTGSSTGSWLSTSVTRGWSVVSTGCGGVNAATLTIEIRNASTLTVLDSAAVTLDAESSP